MCISGLKGNGLWTNFGQANVLLTVPSVPSWIFWPSRISLPGNETRFKNQATARSEDRVWVESPRGRVEVGVKFTDYIMPPQVELSVRGGCTTHGGEWREANANYMTAFDNLDPISGFPVFKALLCEVKKQE
jgi:hypothetical protein